MIKLNKIISKMTALLKNGVWRNAFFKKITLCEIILFFDIYSYKKEQITVKRLLAKREITLN